MMFERQFEVDWAILGAGPCKFGSLTRYVLKQQNTIDSKRRGYNFYS